MKKLYALMAAMMFVSFSFAQVAPISKSGNSMDLKKKPVANTPLKGMNSKGEAGSTWVYYPERVSNYWGVDCPMRSYILAPDSNGLIFPSSSAPWHPNIHGWAQTYDFNHEIYDGGTDIGDISLNYTDHFTIDSVTVYAGYFRGPSYPANVVDTLVVGIVEGFTQAIGSSANQYYFYTVQYDTATLVQKNAHVYKLPLTADMVSVEEDDSYYTAILDLPIGLNISSKTINIAYAFKRGINIPLNDTLTNYSYFSAWLRTDGRSGYDCWATGSFIPFEDHATNLNNGGTVDNDLRFSYVGNPSSDWSDWYYAYYVPTFFWGDMNYPMIFFRASCDNCEIVNVPEIEKNNPTVYPNPATNNFTVNLGNDEKANIQLFNIVGQQVYSETITGTAQVNVANLNSGVYMLKINQNGKVYTSKVIVK